MAEHGVARGVRQEPSDGGGGERQGQQRKIIPGQATLPLALAPPGSAPPWLASSFEDVRLRPPQVD